MIASITLLQLMGNVLAVALQRRPSSVFINLNSLLS